MPHLAQQMTQNFERDLDLELVNSDQANEHNEVDRYTFLAHMREVAPGIVQWFEYICPSDVSAMAFDRGRIIDSETGG
eukprot:1477958-Pyramimonas_sp.AAC.1